MRVAFGVRDDVASVPGGDVVQIERTAVWLERQGIDVVSGPHGAALLERCDILHLFNHPEPTAAAELAALAERRGRPVAVSTIFWTKDVLRAATGSRLPTRVAARLVGVDQLARVYRWERRRAQTPEARLFAAADLLLPNSAAEAALVRQEFPATRSALTVVVPNAAEMLGSGATVIRTPAVLSVGRIEPRKATHLLVEACARMGVPLVLVGAPDSTGYGAQVVDRLTRTGGRHVPHAGRDELGELFAGHAVHAMASWYETPGLASLEAAAAGCAVVSTERGSATEYFLDDANYCDPARPGSVARALEAALSAPPAPGLRTRAMAFTWDLAARTTASAYRQLIDGPSRA